MYRPRAASICAGPVVSVLVNICEKESRERREKYWEGQGGWVRKMHSDKGSQRHGKRERTEPGRQKDEQRQTHSDVEE